VQAGQDDLARVAEWPARQNGVAEVIAVLGHRRRGIDVVIAQCLRYLNHTRLVHLLQENEVGRRQRFNRLERGDGLADGLAVAQVIGDDEKLVGWRGRGGGKAAGG
jgi:hypothetical protein